MGSKFRVQKYYRIRISLRLMA